MGLVLVHGTRGWQAFFMGNIKLETLKMKVADVIYREDLYPRIKADPETISKYSDNLDVLPPIEVNQNNELIDGFHRWQAHKKNDINEISVQVTKTSSDAELLTLAIERNSAHGLQLSAEDKKNMAVKIYSATAEKERIDKKKFTEEGEYELVDHGDCYHFKCHVATYPQDKEKAKELVKEYLSQ